MTRRQQALMGYHWRRNNVRELRNVVERLVFAAGGDRILPQHLPAEIPAVAARVARRAAGRTLAEQRKEAERQIVVAALERNDWQITRTAWELGLADHASLLKIMRRLRIRRAPERG